MEEKNAWSQERAWLGSIHSGYLGNYWEEGKKQEQQLVKSCIKWSHTVSKRGMREAFEQRKGQYDLGRESRKLINS